MWTINELFYGAEPALTYNFYESTQVLKPVEVGVVKEQSKQVKQDKKDSGQDVHLKVDMCCEACVRKVRQVLIELSDSILHRILDGLLAVKSEGFEQRYDIIGSLYRRLTQCRIIHLYHRLLGVTALNISVPTRKVTVMGDVKPEVCLKAIVKLRKRASLWGDAEGAGKEGKKKKKRPESGN